MRAVEFGIENKDVIMLLHGGGLSWWNYRSEAELLRSRFHVILPILDGHSGSDADFTGIEENAKSIISYIDSECSGSVLALGGLSLGAQILVEMLSQRKDICRHAVVESASLLRSNLTHTLIGRAVSASYGLLQSPRFVKAQFKALKIRDDLFEDYARDSCAISKENLISFLRASTGYQPWEGIRSTEAAVRIVVGSREHLNMRLSAKLLHGLVPASRLEIKKGLHHGGYSINRPEDYVRDLLHDLEAVPPNGRL